MNSGHNRVENKDSQTQTRLRAEAEEPAPPQKKPYEAPAITEPQDVLETTRFFFQAAAGGSGL